MRVPAYLDAIIQSKAYRLLRENVGGTLANYGLGMAEWTMLALLYHKGARRPGDLALELGVEAPQVTVLTRQLLKKHYVQVDTHTKDSRAKVLELTADAQSLVPEVEQAVHEGLRPLMRGLSLEDVNAYFHLLERVIENSGT